MWKYFRILPVTAVVGKRGWKLVIPHYFSPFFMKNFGAGEGIRTLDPNLGKVVLLPSNYLLLLINYFVLKQNGHFLCNFGFFPLLNNLLNIS